VFRADHPQQAEEHEFRNNYVPGRKMIAIGG